MANFPSPLPQALEAWEALSRCTHSRVQAKDSVRLAGKLLRLLYVQMVTLFMHFAEVTNTAQRYQYIANRNCRNYTKISPRMEMEKLSLSIQITQNRYQH